MAVVDFLSRIGCIALRAVAKSVRRTDREISDQVFGKMLRNHLTCIGALTEASNRVCFEQVVGPTSASCE